MRKHTEKPFKRLSANYSLQRQVISLIRSHAEAAGLTDSRWLDDLLVRHFKSEIIKPQ